VHAPLKEQMAAVSQIMREYEALGVARGSLHWRALRTQMLETLAGGAADQYQRPPEGSYRAMGGLGHEPSWGGVNVWFGGPQVDPNARLVAVLREQLAAARDQIRHLQALLDQNRQVALNTRNTAQFAQDTAQSLRGILVPRPGGPANAYSAIRTQGGMAPISRP
jgi:hypothetical protein